jgi:NitT/TauT family transport system permease protein
MNKSNKFLSIFLFIIIWQSVAIIANSDVFPSVVDILKSFFEHLLHKDLIYHTGITLQRVFIAFIIAMIIGVFFGIIMGLFPKVDSLLDIFLIIGLNMPALVTIIICYIWFGLTDFSAILAVIINKVPIIIVNIREGIKSIDKKYLDLAKIYEIPKKDIIRKIYLPQIYPYIMATTRLTISLVWKIVLVVELLGRSDGVGFQIALFFQDFDINSIFAYSFAFIFIVILIEKILLNPLEIKMRRWS